MAIGRVGAKNDFVREMASVSRAIKRMKVSPKQTGDIVEEASAPVHTALIRNWLQVDKTGLEGRLKTRVIVKRGQKRPDRVYIGPDFTQYYDFVWNILQWGWVINESNKLGKRKRTTKNTKILGIVPARRFLDKALNESKGAFFKAANLAFDKIMKKNVTS